MLGFPGGSVGKESACSVGELGSIPDHGTKTPRAAQRGQKNKKFKNKIAQLVKNPPAIQETPI